MGGGDSPDGPPKHTKKTFANYRKRLIVKLIYLTRFFPSNGGDVGRNTGFNWTKINF